MFSLPISWPWSGVPGPVFSLDSWLVHLRSWHHFEHSCKPRDTPCDNFKNPVEDVYPAPERLVLDLPSPTIHWSFGYDTEGVEFDSESHSSCTTNSTCPSPIFKHDHGTARDSNVYSSASFQTSTKGLPSLGATPPSANAGIDRQSLLAQYSQQELVLLEFYTHSPHFTGRDIDDVLYLYPPGFCNECRCDSQDGGNLCEVCQLTEAYLDYSFEKYQSHSLASV